MELERSTSVGTSYSKKALLGHVGMAGRPTDWAASPMMAMAIHVASALHLVVSAASGMAAVVPHSMSFHP